MKYALSANPQTVTIPANGQVPVDVTADYVRFDSLPTGLKVAVNGGAEATLDQGIILQGEPGELALNSLRFVNTTGGALSATITTGTGRMTIAGVATLAGTVPLPSGASTAARQDTGNTSLAAIDGKLPALSGGKVPVTDPTALPLPTGAATAALQPAVNQTRTPRVVAVNAGGDVDVTGARQMDVLNTHTSLNLTIVISGQSNFTLGPGQSVGWPMLNPHDASYPLIRVTAPASATGIIEYVL